MSMLSLTIVVLLTSDLFFIDDKNDAMVCLYTVLSYTTLRDTTPPVPYLHQVSGHPACRLLILFTVVFVSNYNLANTTIVMLDLQG